MTPKNIKPIASLLIFLGLVSLIWQKAGAKPDIAKLMETRLPSQRLAAPVRGSTVLRYKTQMDPRCSNEAAQAYYDRREKSIRGFYGNGQVDRVMANLKSGKNLLRWMSMAQQQEMIQALPLMAEMLNQGDEGVQREAAKILCWFGDRRGFDVVMSKIEGPDSAKWWGVFQDDFASQNPTEYLPRIKALLVSKVGSRVDVYVAAQVLAQFGDADSARYLLPVIEREPHMSVDSILKLKNVMDPSVTACMKKLSVEGSPSKVKHAADVVLAHQGDAAAQQRLLEAVMRVTGLPQPQNADGSYKPGMKPSFFGEATPAWDGDAVFALEHCMETVAPEKAVPVLREIAIHADNVRFSDTAIKLLAKIGDEAARNALWDVARSVQAKRRTLEDTLFTTTGKALTLFDDPTSTSLATMMFSGDKHGMEAAQLLAETRGWEGLFKLKLFY
jgi:hypothetical protein